MTDHRQITIARRFAVTMLFAAVFVLPAMSFAQIEDSSEAAGAFQAKVPFEESDSLRFYIEGAQVFITSLPDSINGHVVESYQPIRLPAWTWLAGKSFVWNNEYDNVGRYDVVLGAEVSGLVTDTLRFVMIYTEPESETE